MNSYIYIYLQLEENVYGFSMIRFDFFIAWKDFYMESREIFLSAEMKAMKKFMFAKITVDESFMLLEKVKIEILLV